MTHPSGGPVFSFGNDPRDRPAPERVPRRRFPRAGAGSGS